MASPYIDFLESKIIGSKPNFFAVVLFGSREEKEIERGEGSPRHIIYSGDGNFSLTSFLLTTALN